MVKWPTGTMWVCRSAVHAPLQQLEWRQANYKTELQASHTNDELFPPCTTLVVMYVDAVEVLLL